MAPDQLHPTVAAMLAPFQLEVPRAAPRTPSAPLPNVPKDYEDRLVKMDFKKTADMRERVLADLARDADQVVRVEHAVRGGRAGVDVHVDQRDRVAGHPGAARASRRHLCAWPAAP